MQIAKGFTDAERPRIAALYWQAFGPKLGLVLGPRDRALVYIARVLSPDHAFCARDAKGDPLGVAGFKTHSGALLGGGFQDIVQVYGPVGAVWRVALLSALERDVENRRFVMDGIFVDPAARGRGIGSSLIETIAREAVSRGYAEVRLDVIDANARARALYERRGFHSVGRRGTGLVLRHVFGFEAATTMVRRLG